MFDVKGEPAPGVALRIDMLIPVAAGTLSAPLYRPDSEELRRRDFPAWPGPAVSDSQGRFTLRGLSRDLICPLLVEDPRFALPYTRLQTAENVDPRQPIPILSAIKVDPGPDPKPISIALEPAQTVAGRVTYADTGQPVPRALVATGRFFFEADNDGRFLTSRQPQGNNSFGVQAYSPDSVPYLSAFKRGEWPKGAVEQSLDVALVRGVVVRGQDHRKGDGAGPSREPSKAASMRPTRRPVRKFGRIGGASRRDGPGRHVPSGRASRHRLRGGPGPR